MSVTIPAAVRYEIQKLGNPALVWHKHHEHKWATYKHGFGRPAYFYEIEVEPGKVALYYKEEGRAYRQLLQAERLPLYTDGVISMIFSLINTAQAHHTSIQIDE